MLSIRQFLTGHPSEYNRTPMYNKNVIVHDKLHTYTLAALSNMNISLMFFKKKQIFKVWVHTCHICM